MKTILISFTIALVIALLDILPMIIQKLPRYSTIAAFVHYFCVSVVICFLNIPGLPWWLEGGIVGFLLMVPMLIHVGHEDRKPLPIIGANAIFWGTVAGVASHYLL